MNVLEYRGLRPAWCLVLAVVLVALAGCRHEKASEVEVPLELPGSFSMGGGGARAERWWMVFDDPALDALIEQALERNLGLQVTWSRLEQARALARREGAPLYPQLDGSVGVGGSVSTVSGPGYQLSVSLPARYEVDLWGRIDASIQAAEFDAAATAADLQAAAISLTAQITLTWYALVQTRGLLDLLDQQIAVNDQVLTLFEVRFSNGKTDSGTVLRQRQLVESSRAQHLNLESDEALLLNQLAVLVGRPPGELEVPDVRVLPAPPAVPDAGVPTELLNRRPDVRAALLRVHAADARVAVAIADQYPRLNLSASVGTGAPDITTFFIDWLFRLGADLTAPLFDGGRRAAEVERTQASAEAAVYAYGVAILTALREVEDALIAQSFQTQLVENLERQAELASRAEARVRLVFANGAGSFLELLDAVRTNQNVAQNLIRARYNLLLRHIDLHRALSGAWNLERASDGTSLNPEDTQP